MNFGNVTTNGNDFTNGLESLFRECRTFCRSRRDRYHVENDFNIDDQLSHPMVLICWVLFGLCIIIFSISIPISIINGLIYKHTTSFIVFYSIVGFLFVVSLLANILSCKSLYNHRRQQERINQQYDSTSDDVSDSLYSDSTSDSTYSDIVHEVDNKNDSDVYLTD